MLQLQSLSDDIRLSARLFNRYSGFEASNSAQVSLVDFYRRHGISPVRQDITDLETHFTRRAGLYRHLGLLPGFLKGPASVSVRS